MGLQEEVFKEFLRKLKEDETVPNVVVERLKELLEDNEVSEISQDKIFEIIKSGVQNANKD